MGAVYLEVATLFQFTNRNVATYPVVVETARDGIVAMRLVFELLGSEGPDYSASLFDNRGSSNGWMLERSSNRYLFLFVCQTPTSEFEAGHGAVYGYTAGGSSDLVEWPGTEFHRIPIRCFLTWKQVESLMGRLCKSTEPEVSAGFQFDKACWDRVC